MFTYKKVPTLINTIENKVYALLNLNSKNKTVIFKKGTSSCSKTKEKRLNLFKDVMVFK